MGASITPFSRQHATFPQRPVPFVFAVTDENGIAVLDGQPVGSRQYRIEAPGMQFRIETAIVHGAEVADIGRVALASASGEIWVVLDGTLSEAERIEVELLFPFAAQEIGTPRLTTVMKDGRCVFRGLVVDRRYIISLYRRDAENNIRGQRHVNNIELTHQRSSQEFVVKLSDFSDY
jgi:hypothetical protein